MLCAGGEDGMVRVFDLRDGSPIASHRASDDTLNGFEFHPYLPFAATTSGDCPPLTIHRAGGHFACNLIT